MSIISISTLLCNYVFCRNIPFLVNHIVCPLLCSQCLLPVVTKLLILYDNATWLAMPSRLNYPSNENQHHSFYFHFRELSACQLFYMVTENATQTKTLLKVRDQRWVGSSVALFEPESAGYMKNVPIIKTFNLSYRPTISYSNIDHSRENFRTQSYQRHSTLKTPILRSVSRTLS